MNVQIAQFIVSVSFIVVFMISFESDVESDNLIFICQIFEHKKTKR